MSTFFFFFLQGLTDFQPFHIPVLFTVSQANAPICIGVVVIDDETLENNETFIIELSTTDSDVVLSPVLATVLIVNNDSEF